jgi:hypothetical protein
MVVFGFRFWWCKIDKKSEERERQANKDSEARYELKKKEENPESFTSSNRSSCAVTMETRSRIC